MGNHKQGLSQVLLRTDNELLMTYHLSGGSEGNRPAGDMLLGASPPMQRSLRKRLPYIRSTDHLQVELLRRYRDGANENPLNTAFQAAIEARGATGAGAPI